MKGDGGWIAGWDGESFTPNCMCEVTMIQLGDVRRAVRLRCIAFRFGTLSREAAEAAGFVSRKSQRTVEERMGGIAGSSAGAEAAAHTPGGVLERVSTAT